jgi:hypothetical protein
MEKDIVDGKIGEVGKFDLEFKEGELRFVLDVGKFGLSAGMKVAVKAEDVIDAIAKAIPGQIDDAILQVLKAALKVQA